MKKIACLILTLISLNAAGHKIKTKQFEHVFKNYYACFVLYDVNEQRILSEYNPANRCNQRIAPDSTFKIPLSLIAFNQGTIKQNSVFKWDGKHGELPDWNHDQTPGSWLKYSVVWVSQQITKQLGMERIKHYMDGFNYGNKDFSGDPGKKNGLAYAWLSSSLKISANEQLQFLIALVNSELPLSPNAVSDTKKNMYLGVLDNGFDYYGKTGSGRHGRNERDTHPSQLRDGWFIGFIEHGAQRYVFVSNLTDKTIPPVEDKAYGSQILKPITLKLLNDYFAK